MVGLPGLFEVTRAEWREAAEWCNANGLSGDMRARILHAIGLHRHNTKDTP